MPTDTAITALQHDIRQLDQKRPVEAFFEALDRLAAAETADERAAERLRVARAREILLSSRSSHAA